MRTLNRELNVVFRYDGSLEGFLCCVFQSFVLHGKPRAIVTADEEQQFFAPTMEIETDRTKAARVYRSIVPKISKQALVFVERAFRSTLENKELLLLDFLDQGYDVGARVFRRLTDDTVHTLMGAVRRYDIEAERYRQFVRFSDYDGVLAAEIEPQNDVLIDLAPHFTTRYPNECFLIYDSARKKALIYRPREWRIVPLEGLQFAELSKKEAQLQKLWKLFYDTIAIEERINERCRSNFLPKRYRKHMTEFQEFDDIVREPTLPPHD